MYSHVSMFSVELIRENFNDIMFNETDTFYILKILRCSEGAEQVSPF